MLVIQDIALTSHPISSSQSDGSVSVVSTPFIAMNASFELSSSWTKTTSGIYGVRFPKAFRDDFLALILARFGSSCRRHPVSNLSHYHKYKLTRRRTLICLSLSCSSASFLSCSSAASSVSVLSSCFRFLSSVLIGRANLSRFL